MNDDSSSNPHHNGRQESKALQAILRNSSGELSVDDFFNSVYQEACAVFAAGSHSTSDRADHDDDDDDDPYNCLISHGWQVLIQLLEASRHEAEQEELSHAHLSSSTGGDDDDEEESSMAQEPHHHETLLFQNQASLGSDACQSRYHHSLFAACLDGCSVLINHADTLSPFLASLCGDLQHSFPHAYANTYLTPPHTQSVPAHADDRDVLVVQILGAKEWIVYQRIPVPYPYPHEQVGKHGLVVPDVVLEGPVLFKRILKPGDILYMPRGFVHCAKALPGDCSFHATVALATHDWTTAGLVATATHQALHQVVDYRKAMDRKLGTRDYHQVPAASKQQLQATLNDVWDRLREQVTVESLHDALQEKYWKHNERVRSRRQALIAQQQQQSAGSGATTTSNSSSAIVGRQAAERVYMHTVVRTATSDEKASLPVLSQPRGLQVSNDCYDALIHVLGMFKQDPFLTCRVDRMQALCDEQRHDACKDYLCDLTWLAFARQCVELGAFAVVDGDSMSDA